MMKVKPSKPGLLVKDPMTRRALPPGGAEVKQTSYWLRRLRDGDVVEVKEVEPDRSPPRPATKRERAAAADKADSAGSK